MISRESPFTTKSSTWDHEWSIFIVHYEASVLTEADDDSTGTSTKQILSQWCRILLHAPLKLMDDLLLPSPGSIVLRTVLQIHISPWYEVIDLRVFGHGLWYLPWLCNCRPNPSPFFRHNLLPHSRMMWHNRSRDWWFIRLSAYLREWTFIKIYRDERRGCTCPCLMRSLCIRCLHGSVPWFLRPSLSARLANRSVQQLSYFDLVFHCRVTIDRAVSLDQFLFSGGKRTPEWRGAPILWRKTVLISNSLRVNFLCRFRSVIWSILLPTNDLPFDFCQLTWMVLMTVRISDQPLQLELALEMAWKNHLCYL